jgi:hypothetical protein
VGPEIYGYGIGGPLDRWVEVKPRKFGGRPETVVWGLHFQRPAVYHCFGYCSQCAVPLLALGPRPLALSDPSLSEGE